MNKLVYSPVVKRKMLVLKERLAAQFDPETANKVLTGITNDADSLKSHEEMGTNIARMYDLDTEYRYLFTHQHYLIYRIEPGKVTIVQMFHEREDFMMKLFGMSGRTEESIDYWGE